MNIKVLANYIMVRMGIRQILPGEIIKKVKLEENHDPLVRIDENENIIIADRMEPPIYLRSHVYDMLKSFIEEVGEDGYKVKLYDAYRSFDEQKASWEQRIKDTKAEHPDLPDEEIEKLTSLKVSNITDKENVGGHQTGGAIDITLVDKDGEELDMGTRYEEYSEKTHTKNSTITEEQKKNRRYMCEKLEKLGFNNFPAEWWHYSYGDKMWAAYKNKKTCMYGYIEPEQEVKNEQKKTLVNRVDEIKKESKLEKNSKDRDEER